MNIIPICPFCNAPLVFVIEDRECTYVCTGRDGHFYGVNADTEEEAHAVVAAPQQRLVEALTAMIALPIEQRKTAAALQRIAQLELYVRHVHDTFKRDIEQGYNTRDKEFAVDLLGKALK